MLAYLIDDQPPILSENDRNEIERLIVRDHKFHETKRPRRRANNNRPTKRRRAQSADRLSAYLDTQDVHPRPSAVSM